MHWFQIITNIAVPFSATLTSQRFLKLDDLTGAQMVGVVTDPLSQILSWDPVAIFPPTCRQARLWSRDPVAKSLLLRWFWHSYPWLVGHFWISYPAIPTYDREIVFRDPIVPAAGDPARNRGHLSLSVIRGKVAISINELLAGNAQAPTQVIIEGGMQVSDCTHLSLLLLTGIRRQIAQMCGIKPGESGSNSAPHQESRNVKARTCGLALHGHLNSQRSDAAMAHPRDDLALSRSSPTPALF